MHSAIHHTDNPNLPALLMSWFVSVGTIMTNSDANSPMFNKIYICSYTPNGLKSVCFPTSLTSQLCWDSKNCRTFCHTSSKLDSKSYGGREKEDRQAETHWENECVILIFLGHQTKVYHRMFLSSTIFQNKNLVNLNKRLQFEFVNENISMNKIKNKKVGFFFFILFASYEISQLISSFTGQD